MIEVKNLTKYYGPVLAIDKINFSIEKGQIVGFLGPNGAGKTTAIRILTCFMPASGGSAKVAGHDVFTESMQVRQKIGYLPESVPFYGEMRVSEYLEFRGRLRGLDRETRKRRIGFVTERCWLDDVFTRPIGQLSKGYRQRLGLADALLHDPEVLILDEPTVGLDPTQIRSTRKLIHDLAERHTILLSSHILSEVETICQHSIIIAGGKIVAAGSIDQLREQIREQSRLIVEIKGPTDRIESAIRNIESVKSLETLSADGYAKLAIQMAERADPRERIYELTVKNNWPIREMRLEMATLEDFFIRVVAQQIHS